MNAREYALEIIKNWQVNVSDSFIDLHLNNAGLELKSPYDSKKMDNFFYGIIPLLLSLNPKSFSEGGFSISFDKEAIETYYKDVCKRLGKSSSRVTITDISNKW